MDSFHEEQNPKVSIRERSPSEEKLFESISTTIFIILWHIAAAEKTVIVVVGAIVGIGLAVLAYDTVASLPVSVAIVFGAVIIAIGLRR